MNISANRNEHFPLATVADKLGCTLDELDLVAKHLGIRPDVLHGSGVAYYSGTQVHRLAEAIENFEPEQLDGFTEGDADAWRGDDADDGELCA